MYDDINGDEFGDDILGDDGVGDEIVGDEIVGDEIMGDELVGDDLLGDEVLVSGDEIMGDDFNGGDMGAIFRRRRRNRGRQQQQQLQQARQRQALQDQQRARMQARHRAIMARKLANAKLVVKKGPTKARVQSIGFNFTGVAPGATVDIPARPQVKFRGTRLSIPSSLAQNFLIEDLKVGRGSQFVAAGAQSAETFKDTATADNVAMDTADPGMDIILSVTNTTGTAADFHATLFGDAVE